MSDQKLRELERRWKETRSLDDEVAYLLERVRVGDTTRERLELAGYCGHEGATRALSVTGASVRPMPSSFGAWAYLPVSRTDQFKAALNVIRRAIAQVDERANELWMSHQVPRPDTRGRDALLQNLVAWVEAFEQRCTDPPKKTRVGRSSAEQALKKLRDASEFAVRLPGSNAADVATAQAIVLAAEVLGEDRARRIVGSTIAGDIMPQD